MRLTAKRFHQAEGTSLAGDRALAFFVGVVLTLVCDTRVAVADEIAQAVSDVLEAVRGEDADERLKTLARRSHPDPWIVCDELCAAGEPGVARLFAAVYRPNAFDGPWQVESPA